uniref:Uncharacterized protein n=1 Tax=Anguilla anguilla TaxID=7936 RepID=A0A0E9VP04_ANGAN
MFKKNTPEKSDFVQCGNGENAWFVHHTLFNDRLQGKIKILT